MRWGEGGVLEATVVICSIVICSIQSHSLTFLYLSPPVPPPFVGPRLFSPTSVIEFAWTLMSTHEHLQWNLHVNESAVSSQRGQSA